MPASKSSAKPRSKCRKRQCLLHCRVSTEERAQIKERAGMAGVSVSMLLRESAMSVPIRHHRKRIPNLDQRRLAQVLANLGKVGSNLNQLARVANTNGALDDIPSLRAALSELRAIHGALVEIIE